jgi:hypothetical protein
MPQFRSPKTSRTYAVKTDGAVLSGKLEPVCDVQGVSEYASALKSDVHYDVSRKFYNPHAGEDESVPCLRTVLRHYVRNWKVAGSSPDDVIKFFL